MRFKKIALFSIALIAIVSFYILNKEKTYDMQVNINLVVDKKPIPISRVVTCKPSSRYVGFQKQTEYYLDPRMKVFSHHLDNGSAILIWTPEACQLARYKHVRDRNPQYDVQDNSIKREDGRLAHIGWNPIPQDNIPLIGWLEDANNTDFIQLYTSPFAYKNPNAKIAFEGITIDIPDLHRKVDKPDEYAWLGTTNNPFTEKKYQNQGKSYLNDQNYRAFFAKEPVNWAKDYESPLRDINKNFFDRLRKHKPRGTHNISKYEALLPKLLKENSDDLEYLTKIIQKKTNKNIKFSHETIARGFKAFGRYDTTALFSGHGLLGHSYASMDKAILDFIFTQHLSWFHSIPIEIKKNSNFLREDMAGFVFLYSENYLNSVRPNKNKLILSEHVELEGSLLDDLEITAIYLPDIKKIYKFSSFSMHHFPNPTRTRRSF